MRVSRLAAVLGAVCCAAAGLGTSVAWPGVSVMLAGSFATAALGALGGALAGAVIAAVVSFTLRVLRMLAPGRDQPRGKRGINAFTGSDVGYPISWVDDRALDVYR